MKLVKPNRNKSDEDVYHSDPSCPHVTPAYLDLNETTQPAAEFRECDVCADNVTKKGRNGHGCPFCGDTVSKLPDHLPCEETP